MEKVGILNIVYGARGTAINDTLFNSKEYEVELYIVDKQANPHNQWLADESGGRFIVDPDLSNEMITKFARANKDKIDFALCPNEGPIIRGIRNILEWELEIPTICPTKEYALEGSKVRQRQLLKEVAPEANPAFRIFDPADYKHTDDLYKDVEEWIVELGGPTECVIKPDKPGFGKGVGVGREHFSTVEEAKGWIDLKGKTIIEQHLYGEESSFQAYCDGIHLVPLPETRDYKRAYDGDIGLNTGGMGSYCDKWNYLPFLRPSDIGLEIEIAKKILRHFTKEDRNTGLLGMPFYIAFMHTSEGSKILEINSRPGDPEHLCTLQRLNEDLVDVYHRILDGTLNSVKTNNMAAVATYLVPEPYPKKDNKTRMLSLNSAYKLIEHYNKLGDATLKIYPASVEMRSGNLYALGSRAVASVGIAEDLQTARNVSLDGIDALYTDGFRYRRDIASEGHTRKSIEHMKKLAYF